MHMHMHMHVHMHMYMLCALVHAHSMHMYMHTQVERILADLKARGVDHNDIMKTTGACICTCI